MALLDRDRLTCIGRIVGAHGMDGALRVKPETDDPAFYTGQRRIYVDAEEGLRRHDVSLWRGSGTEWVLALRGVETRDAAERLKGGEVLLDDSALKPLEEGEYFQHDLVGCVVVDEAGRLLGSVAGVVEAGGETLLDVREGQRAVMLPMVETVIRSVDVKARRIVASPPAGLIEPD